MAAATLTKVAGSRFAMKDERGCDVRALIYHAACHRLPGYDLDTFVACVLPVLARPQLVAINGRPC